MDTPPPSMRELAHKLWAASRRAPDPDGRAAPLVNENLGRALAEFAGAEGFLSLLRRSIVLASAEVPGLRAAAVSPDGRVQGIEQLVKDSGTAEQAAIAVTAQMLGLLVAFIGESLTQRLVREACPDTSPGE